MCKKMETEFVHLNKNWNAEPNDPAEVVEKKDGYLSITFSANPWAYEGYEEGQKLELRFYGCTEWRNGDTNDEGWYSGQCRFSKIAPRWGEFYEVRGDPLLEKTPNDWHRLASEGGEKHFLFYLRDSTFECKANSYELIQQKNT